MLFYKIIWHINCFLKKIFLKLIYRQKIKFGKNVQFRKRFNIFIDKYGKLVIGDNTFFNNDCSINVKEEVKIGKNCLFGENVKIYDHNHVFKYKNELIKNQGYKTEKIEIKDNSWIGSNAIILKGTKIGKHCVIAAGEKIKDINIEDNEIVAESNKNKIKMENI